jgi:N-acetylmuramoyl-L-alanine amidase
MFIPWCQWMPSPHYGRRKGRPRGVVIHGTAGSSAESSARWFVDPLSRVSAHFTIGRDGSGFQSVDTDRSAWHAGTAEIVIDGEARSDVNSQTIGIELANRLLLERRGDLFVWKVGGEWRPYAGPDPVYAGLWYDDGRIVKGWWEPYPEAQIDALIRLLHDLRANGIEVDPIVGHHDCAMPLGRKLDPGGAFPWDRVPRAYARAKPTEIA